MSGRSSPLGLQPRLLPSERRPRILKAHPANQKARHGRSRSSCCDGFSLPQWWLLPPPADECDPPPTVAPALELCEDEDPPLAWLPLPPQVAPAPDECAAPPYELVGRGGVIFGRAGALPPVRAGTSVLRGALPVAALFCATFPTLAPFAPLLPFAAASSAFSLVAEFPFTKRCWLASYTIEESRLTVTARLPAGLARIVRDTRVGAAVVAKVDAASEFRGGVFSADHL